VQQQSLAGRRDADLRTHYNPGGSARSMKGLSRIIERGQTSSVSIGFCRTWIVGIAAIRRTRAGARSACFGTLQNRLPKELKLAGITDIEAALSRHPRGLSLCA